MIMGEKIFFGVYGYPKSFLESPMGKKRENIFEWLYQLNLNAFLLDWTYGTSMTSRRAKKYHDLACKYHVELSLHAPKDIDFISLDPKRKKYSEKQLKRACELAKKLKCQDLIIGLGDSPVLLDREEVKKQLISLFLPYIKKYPSIRFHFEPAMKRKEYGSLEELISLCKDLDHCYPSFNLMRLHAWHGCTLIYPERIIKLLKQIEEGLGFDALSRLYVQICPISYEHGRFFPKTFGELKTGQLSFFDSNFEYFPKANDYIQAISSLGITPVTISNTYQTEELGAMRLRDTYFYHQLKEKK